jgi:hypothetical protein
MWKNKIVNFLPLFLIGVFSIIITIVFLVTHTNNQVQTECVNNILVSKTYKGNKILIGPDNQPINYN